MRKVVCGALFLLAGGPALADVTLNSQIQRNDTGPLIEDLSFLGFYQAVDSNFVGLDLQLLQGDTLSVDPSFGIDRFENIGNLSFDFFSRLDFFDNFNFGRPESSVRSINQGPSDQPFAGEINATGSSALRVFERFAIGTLDISNGFEFRNDATFADLAGVNVLRNSVGTVRVDGAGTSLSTRQLSVDTLNISDGGLVEVIGLESVDLSQASNPFAFADLGMASVAQVAGETSTISGPGSALNFSSVLNIGDGLLVISDGGRATQTNPAATAETIRILNEAFGPDDYRSGIQVSGEFGPADTDDANLIITGTGSEAVSNDDVFIAGTVRFDGVNNEIVTSDGTARVIVEDGGSLQAANEIIVGTQFEAVGDPTQGELIVRNGGSVTATTLTLAEGGLLSGDGGNIFGDVQLRGGTIAPGASPGILTISEDLIVDDGVIDLEIASTSLFDRLVIGGDLIVSDQLFLNISFLDGFLPAEGDRFDLISVSGMAEIFSNPQRIVTNFFGLGDLPEPTLDFASGGFAVVVGDDDNDDPTGPSEVPIPASGVLLFAAFAGLVGLRRRKSI